MNKRRKIIRAMASAAGGGVKRPASPSDIIQWLTAYDGVTPFVDRKDIVTSPVATGVNCIDYNGTNAYGQLDEFIYGENKTVRATMQLKTGVYQTSIVGNAFRNSGDNIIIYDSAGSPRFSIRCGNAAGDGYVQYSYASAALTALYDDGMHEIVVSRTTTTVSLSIDGVDLVVDGALSGTAGNTYISYVGRDNGGLGTDWNNGKISYVRIEGDTTEEFVFSEGQGDFTDGVANQTKLNLTNTTWSTADDVYCYNLDKGFYASGDSMVPIGVVGEGRTNCMSFDGSQAVAVDFDNLAKGDQSAYLGVTIHRIGDLSSNNRALLGYGAWLTSRCIYLYLQEDTGALGIEVLGADSFVSTIIPVAGDAVYGSYDPVTSKFTVGIVDGASEVSPVVGNLNFNDTGKYTIAVRPFGSSWELDGDLSDAYFYHNDVLRYSPALMAGYGDPVDRSRYDLTPSTITGTWTVADGTNLATTQGHIMYSNDLGVSISKYYDNRVCGLSVTTDDLRETNYNDFDAFVQHAYANDISPNVAVITQECSTNAWATMQGWIDAGEATAVNHNTVGDPVPDDHATIKAMIEQSTSDLETELTLQSYMRYNGNNRMTGWTTPYGTANEQDYIREVLADNNYLSDRTTANPMSAYPYFDYSLSMFDRVDSIGVSALQTGKDLFDRFYAEGGICGFLAHPAGSATVNPGDLWYDLLIYLGGKTDVWYATYENLMLYRYLARKATPLITKDDSTAGEYEITVTADHGERVKYALSYPLTYRVEVPSSATTVTVSYREEGGTYAPMTAKLSTDIFNGIDAYRNDLTNDCVYISHALPQTKDVMQFKVEYS